MNLKPMKELGATLYVSDEWELLMSGFERKGYLVETPLTKEDRLARKRARAALKELERNPWVEADYEGGYSLRKLEPRREFIPEETPEEHMARWKAAGCPRNDRKAGWLDLSIYLEGEQ